MAKYKSKYALTQSEAIEEEDFSRMAHNIADEFWRQHYKKLIPFMLLIITIILSILFHG